MAAEGISAALLLVSGAVATVALICAAGPKDGKGVAFSSLWRSGINAVAVLLQHMRQWRRQRQRRCRVLLLGLDNAGKTSLCHILSKRQGWPSQTRPGHHVLHYECEVGNVSFDLLDPTGDGVSSACRQQLWAHCLSGIVDAVVFVVDAADRTRLGEARQALRWLLQHKADDGVPMLILGNKVDLPRALGSWELERGLGLTGLTSEQRKALLQPEGLSRLHVELRHRIASFHPDDAAPEPKSVHQLRMCSASKRWQVQEGFLWLAEQTALAPVSSNQASSCLSKGSIACFSVLSRSLGCCCLGRHAMLLPTHVA